MFVPLSYFEMNVLKEQRVCIKFCLKLGKTATETYEMLQQALGETALSRSKTFEMYSLFKNVRTFIVDDPQTGRPSTAQTNETVDHVNAVINGKRHLAIRDCLHNHSATPSRCSLSETASQMVFRYLASVPQQCAMPRGPEWFPTCLPHQIWSPTTSSSFPG
jgi:hypothetical protein